MYISYHPIYNHPVPDNHRFPMQKYTLLSQQFPYEGVVDPADSHTPPRINLETLCSAHTPDYVHKSVHLQPSYKEALFIGFVQNQQLADRKPTLIQGAIEAALWALHIAKVGFNIAGGTYHAFSDRGEGFRMLNDQTVAAAYLLAHAVVREMLIIDLDVH